MLRAAIFDMDGTLLDSMHVWNTVGEDYLRTKGKVPPDGFVERVRALGMRETADYLRSELGVEDPPEQIIREILQFVNEQYLHVLPLKPGVKEFLQKLHGMGVRLCVATASDRSVAEAALARTGVLGLFDFLMTCDEAGSGKQQPLIFERAIERLGSSKMDTVVFEDAAHAVQTAAQAGFRVAAIYDESAAAEQEQIRSFSEVYLESFTGLDPEIF